ncbi:hypothetical protein D9757_010196 [Collybiopsis confluens]|uniref:P-type Cu(+) transporter n=1 Tax=Collybiopsis confluens TaxID=2823264 RepID=A0A8H5GPL7_9AGAR|nr:hypothetical protein D9757_010196 [Collybiopsis confluens]
MPKILKEIRNRTDLPGVEDATEPLMTETNKAEFSALDALGVEKCELSIEGMTCGSSVEAIEGMLRPQAGIHSIEVTLSAERGVVEYDSKTWSVDKIIAEISDIGFNATLIPPSRKDIESLTRTNEIMALRSQLMWSLLFALPVFFLITVPEINLFGGIQIYNGVYLSDFLIMVLTTPAQFWVGAKLYQNVFKSLRHGTATMDTLVMLGTSSAYFYSLISLMSALFNTTRDFRPMLSFDTSAMLIMFVSLVRYLEKNAKGKTSAGFIELAEDAQISKQTFADKVAGCFLPTLGFITFIVWVTISSNTSGESLPEMSRSSKFMVNLRMYISFIVLACPCTLGLSSPSAIMIAAGMGAKNGILVKNGRALEASTSIKRIVIDKTGTVTVGKFSVFGLCWAPADGTENTESCGGDLDLGGLCADGVTTFKSIVAMVSATEARSGHPLAKAIAVYGKDLLKAEGSEPNVTIESFESVTGAGVKALLTCAGQKCTLLVGNVGFVTASNNGSLCPSLSAFEAQETELGRTVIYVAIQKNVSAQPLPILSISLADLPKPSSKYAIRTLQNMGIDVHMMTGDSKGTAIAIAKQVGIRPENVWSAMTPKRKATMITEWIEKYGDGVAMVGDGINDSPALAAATVGIALSSSPSAAIESADVVLTRSNLLDVVAALHLSCSVFVVIKRSPLWAEKYNVLGITLAMLFLRLGPDMYTTMAGAVITSSGMSVAMSSLMLKFWRRPAVSLMPDELPLDSEADWTERLFDEGLSDNDYAWISVQEASKRQAEYEDSQLPVEMSDISAV